TRDALTGLPNRNLLADRASQAILTAARTRGSLAVLFLDLDRFNLVNDSLGHGAGDALLRAVAERLGGGLRRDDTPARPGGRSAGDVRRGGVSRAGAGRVRVELAGPAPRRRRARRGAQPAARDGGRRRPPLRAPVHRSRAARPAGLSPRNAAGTPANSFPHL